MPENKQFVVAVAIGPFDTVHLNPVTIYGPFTESEAEQFVERYTQHAESHEDVDVADDRYFDIQVKPICDPATAFEIDEDEDANDGR